VNLVNLSELKYKYEIRSFESKVVLFVVIILILYFYNTQEKQVVEFVSNLWLSVLLSIIAAVVWFMFTRKR